MLTQCPANPIGIHDCVHGEDAGVQCALSGIAWKVSIKLATTQIQCDILLTGSGKCRCILYKA